MKSVNITQNEEVPTGAAEITLTDGTEATLYVSDVNEIQEELKEAKEGFCFGDTRKYFVPCYNEQNGYYSNYLEIHYGKVVQVIDGYKKGKPHYFYTLIPIEKIEGCDLEEHIY